MDVDVMFFQEDGQVFVGIEDKSDKYEVEEFCVLEDVCVVIVRVEEEVFYY